MSLTSREFKKEKYSEEISSLLWTSVLYVLVLRKRSNCATVGRGGNL